MAESEAVAKGYCAVALERGSLENLCLERWSFQVLIGCGVRLECTGVANVGNAIAPAWAVVGLQQHTRGGHHRYWVRSQHSTALQE
jgi:hypothetical protein